MATENLTPLTVGTHHVTFGAGRFGWWVGVLRRGRKDVWQCQHQHKPRSSALVCVQELLDVIDGVTNDAIAWRKDVG